MKFILLCLLVNVQVWGAAPLKTPSKSPSSLMELQQNLQKLSRFKVNFDQKVYVNNEIAGDSTAGVLVLEKPDKFRFEILSPEESKKIVVANGDKIEVYQPGLDASLPGTKEVYSKGKSPVEIWFSVFKGDLKDFSVTPKNKTSFILKPKKKELDVSSLEITISEQKFIQKLVLNYKAGNKSEINLKSPETNADFARAFQLVVPSNTIVRKGSSQ